jgi:ferritin
MLGSEDRASLQYAVEQELYASNFYKYAATCCQRMGYFGAQKFFEKESADEIEHYYMHRDFLNDRGDEADMPAIEEVDFPKDDSLEGIVDMALKMEKDLGDYYNKKYFATKDASVQVHLMKFVDIQTKAVGEYLDLMARISLVKNNEAGLLLIDQELGK